MQQHRLGVFGSQFAEKDPWALVDNLNIRQQCALTVKKANGIMKCFSKRSRGQQSQGILHLYSTCVGLCLSTVSSYRLPPYKNNTDLLEGVYSEGLWDGQRPWCTSTGWERWTSSAWRREGRGETLLLSTAGQDWKMELAHSQRSTVMATDTSYSKVNSISRENGEKYHQGGQILE